MYLYNIFSGIINNTVTQILIVSQILRAAGNDLGNLVSIICFSIIELIFTEIQKPECDESVCFARFCQCIAGGA